MKLITDRLGSPRDIKNISNLTVLRTTQPQNCLSVFLKLLEMVSRKKYENEELEILPERAKQVPTGVHHTNLSYSFKNLSLACSSNGSRSWSQ